MAIKNGNYRESDNIGQKSKKKQPKKYSNTNTIKNLRVVQKITKFCFFLVTCTMMHCSYLMKKWIHSVSRLLNVIFPLFYTINKYENINRLNK